jgi:hypothetical protein
MLDHHMQKSIVYALAFAESLRFSELQPDDVDSKLFTYHLKKTVVAGLVAKRTDGTYALTPEGRRIGKTVLKKDRFMDQAYSILLLAVRRSTDGAWLLYKRHTHPLIDLSGFMQAIPNAKESIITTAKLACYQKTGLSGDFRIVAGGYFRVFQAGELESFTHFTLLACDNIIGDLVSNDDFGEYYWQKDPDFSAPQMLPTAQALANLFNSPSVSFSEHDFQV